MLLQYIQKSQILDQLERWISSDLHHFDFTIGSGDTVDGLADRSSKPKTMLEPMALRQMNLLYRHRSIEKQNPSRKVLETMPRSSTIYLLIYN